jgi:hypothetical protein
MQIPKNGPATLCRCRQKIVKHSGFRDFSDPAVDRYAAGTRPPLGAAHILFSAREIADDAQVGSSLLQGAGGGMPELQPWF